MNENLNDSFETESDLNFPKVVISQPTSQPISQRNSTQKNVAFLPKMVNASTLTDVEPIQKSDISEINKTLMPFLGVQRPRALSQKFLYRFKLDGHDISDYLMACQRFGRMNSASDREIILHALQNFDSPADANIVQDSLTPQELVDWDLFSARLIVQFGKSREDWFYLFENHKRTANESCAQLLAYLTLCFKKGTSKTCLSEDNKDSIVRRYKGCVHPDLYAQLESKNIADYATIACESQRLERAFRIPRVKVANIINTTVETSMKPHVPQTRPPPQNSSMRYPNRQQNERQQNERQNERYCYICNFAGHCTKDCWLNPVSDRYRGEDWVKQALKSRRTNSKNE